MSISVEVPALGESITEAIVAQWEVEVGDFVEADAPLVELETDKITVTVPAPAAGRVTEIRKGPDDRVEVGEVIALIEEGEAPAGDSGDDKKSESGDGKKSSKNVDSDSESDGSSETSDDAKPSDEPVSPSVRRMLEEHNLSASEVPASGPRNRLTKEDVQKYLDSDKSKKGSKTKSKQEREKPRPAGGAQEEEVVPMSSLRRRVAERLVSAQRDAAILTTFNDADLSAVMDLRKQYKDKFVDKYGMKLGFMSFFVKACVEALKAYPAVNAELRDESIVYKNYYHVGVAVGGGKGLVVPVVRNADQLSFAEVEQEIGRLAKKARDNRLTLDELTGGTFTISNGGVYGSMLSTPILNPPQVGILGMHRIEERPVVVDGEIVVRPMMYLALSYDHRVIDGREAVGFLVRVKECIENPERILLEI